MTMKEALEQMRKHAMHANCTQIAMPLIGCGLDKLEWEKVSYMVRQELKDLDFEVLVCVWERNIERGSARNPEYNVSR